MFFLNVNNSDNKNLTLKEIRNCIDPEIKNFIYFPLNQNVVFVFDIKDLNSDETIKILETLYFIKNENINNDFIFFGEVEEKLFVLMFINGKYSIEKDLDMEIASFLAYYEEYSESATLFYMFSNNMEVVVSELKEIYELENSSFTQIKNTFKYEEISKSLVFSKISFIKYFSRFKLIFKENKKMLIYLLILIITILFSAKFIIDYYDKIEREKIAEKLKIEQKQSMTFKILNRNISQSNLIKTLLRDRYMEIIKIKDNKLGFIGNEKFIPNTLKVSKKIKISEKISYIEGSILKTSHKRDIKYIKPIVLNEIFSKFKGQTYINNNSLFLSAYLNKRQLINLINDISYDNKKIYNISIQKNLNNFYVFLELKETKGKVHGKIHRKKR